MEFSKENIRKIRGLILFTIIILVCLWRYTDVLKAVSIVISILLPFILGGAIAFIMNVPTHFFEVHLFKKWKNSKNKLLRRSIRPLSLILTLICVFGVIGLVLFVVVPQLAETFSRLGNSIRDFMPKVEAWTIEKFGNNKEILEWIDGLEFDWANIAQTGMKFFSDGAGSIVDSTFSAVKNIVSGITTFFVAFAFACYIIIQKESLNIQLRKVLFAFVPKGRAEASLEIFSLTYRTFSNFLTGQCVEAIILGGMFVVSMYLFRMPYALLVGVVIAFTALIPIFGAFIGCALGMFLIFIENPIQAIAFFVLFIVLQQIEGNLIYPHVVGNSVGLPSIYVLAAVSIGGRIMGITGMLIFIPIVSVLYALFREIVYIKLKKNKIKESDITESS